VSVPTQGYRRGAPAADRKLRWLTLSTAFATFALIVVGGVVRVSDSGLGCGPESSGFHGWPFCNGDVVPGVGLHSIIEYTHRVLASAVALMLLALAVLAWRRHRRNRALVWSTTAAFALVVAQGLLGAATVEQGLDEGLVAAHLGLAMLCLGLVIYAWRATREDVLGAAPADGGRHFRTLSVAATALVLCTIVAGGYMAGTQNYGRPDYQLGDGAHHACGKQFPTCNGSFMPFGKARLVDIHLTHRAFMYLTAIAVLALVALALRRRPSPRVVTAARLLLGLLVVQILVGALNVWLDEYEALIVIHLALGTLLWVTAVGLSLELFRVPAPAEERAGTRRAEAVAA
jgi:heme A synthase